MQALTDFCLSEWNRKLAQGGRRISDRGCVLSLNTNHLNPRLREAKKEGQRKKRGREQVPIKLIVQKFIPVQELGWEEREVMYLF